MFCKEAQYNELSSFWFQRAEDTLRSLFHDPKGLFNSFHLSNSLWLCFYSFKSNYFYHNSKSFINLVKTVGLIITVYFILIIIINS